MKEIVDPVRLAKEVARDSLFAGTKAVHHGLPAYTAWICAGFAVAVGLVLANVDTVSKFIELTKIRWAAALMLASLLLAVVSTFLNLIVGSALSAQEAGHAIALRLQEKGQAIDLSIFEAEYKDGLLPHIRLISGKLIDAAKAGDIGKAVRLTAKLSQVSAVLVCLQGVFASAALLLLVVGMRVQ